MRVAMLAMLPVLTVLSAGASGAAAEVVTPPDWVKRPTPEELLGAWPRAAIEKAVEGKAKIECVVTTRGGLRDCKVAAEEPAGMGFGQAALSLTPQFLFRPAMRDGAPIESRIVVPIAFPKLHPDVRASMGSRSEPAHGSRIYEDRRTSLYSFQAWDAAPSVADVAAAYPAGARAAKLPGRATLACQIGRAHTLDGCSVVSEHPKGQGFAPAARMLARKFKAPTTDHAGRSTVGGWTHVPFAFSPELLQAGEPLIGKPTWTATPSVEDFNAAFPQAAASAGVLKARVVLSCTITGTGGVSGCNTLSEDPPGMGFGEAAASLADKFRLSNWSSEGLPTAGGKVRIPIRYELQQVAQPQSAPANP